VKEKTSAPALTTSDDDMDLLEDDESPLIKDGSPPPIDMDINKVFTLSTEFRGAEEIALMWGAIRWRPEAPSPWISP
jgi:hypothetical protein